MYWYIWLAIGLLFLIIEIVTPGFLFLSFGVGAIITGLTANLFPDLRVQLVIFSIITLITFLMMKKFAGYLLKPGDNPKSNVEALLDKKGIVTMAIQPGKKGYVKIGGEEWSAIASNPESLLEEGTTVQILRIEGNKVIVTK